MKLVGSFARTTQSASFFMYANASVATEHTFQQKCVGWKSCSSFDPSRHESSAVVYRKECYWDEFTGTRSIASASLAVNFSRSNLSNVYEHCLGVGPTVCQAITCTGEVCTMRPNSQLEPADGDTTYLPSTSCHQAPTCEQENDRRCNTILFQWCAWGSHCANKGRCMCDDGMCASASQTCVKQSCLFTLEIARSNGSTYELQIIGSIHDTFEVSGCVHEGCNSQGTCAIHCHEQQINEIQNDRGEVAAYTDCCPESNRIIKQTSSCDVSKRQGARV